MFSAMSHIKMQEVFVLLFSFEGHSLVIYDMTQGVPQECAHVSTIPQGCMHEGFEGICSISVSFLWTP